VSRSRPAAGLAAGILVVLLLLGCGGSTGTSSTSPERSGQSRPAARGPVIVNVERLRELAHSVGHPIFWAGRQPGADELTVDVNGNVFIRYLPEAVPAGSRRRTSLTVATYPFADAYGTLQAASRQPGATVGHTPDGGLVVAAKGSPDNVHVAYSRRDIQIEVYDPHRGRALELATAGAIVPIR
jgi:hypothetical protein